MQLFIFIISAYVVARLILVAAIVADHFITPKKK